MASIGTLPDTVKPTAVEITSMHQIFTSVGQNLSSYKSDRGGHRWKISITYPPMTRDNYSALWAFLVSARGQFNYFTYNLENHAVQGSADTNLTVNENVTAGTRTLALANLQTGTNAIAGDFIKFGNNYKVYMLTSDLVDEGSNLGTANIEPALQADVTTGVTVAFSTTTMPFSVSLTDNNVVTEFGTQQLYGTQIELVENSNA